MPGNEPVSPVTYPPRPTLSSSHRHIPYHGSDTFGITDSDTVPHRHGAWVRGAWHPVPDPPERAGEHRPAGRARGRCSASPGGEPRAAPRRWKRCAFRGGPWCETARTQMEACACRIGRSRRSRRPAPQLLARMRFPWVPAPRALPPAPHNICPARATRAAVARLAPSGHVSAGTAAPASDPLSCARCRLVCIPS